MLSRRSCWLPSMTPRARRLISSIGSGRFVAADSGGGRPVHAAASGDVDVVDADGQRIRAEKLTYRLDSERIVAEPQAGRQVTSRLKLRQANGQAPSPLLP